MPTTTHHAKRGAKLLFRWCLLDGKLDEKRARLVVKYVLQSRRRGYLTVLGELKRLMKLERSRHTARVESAVPLQPELQARLRKKLETVYGEAISTEFAQNPDLIGGVRIQIASDVYDSSVKAKLAALATSFGIVNKQKAVR
jgi:F-type H+-transporting ATPase subunit delta